MKFTTMENACHNLRQIGKSIVCPPDQFFGPLADAIESCGVAENHRLRGVVNVLADELAKHTGRTMPQEISDAEAVVAKGEQ